MRNISTAKLLDLIGAQATNCKEAIRHSNMVTEIRVLSFRHAKMLVLRHTTENTWAKEEARFDYTASRARSRLRNFVLVIARSEKGETITTDLCSEHEQ